MLMICHCTVYWSRKCKSIVKKGSELVLVITPEHTPAIEITIVKNVIRPGSPAQAELQTLLPSRIF